MQTVSHNATTKSTILSVLESAELETSVIWAAPVTIVRNSAPDSKSHSLHAVC